MTTKGYKQTEESKRKNSEAHKGKIASIETRKKMRESHIGLFVGKNHPMYGVHRMGKDAPNYGKKHTPKTIKKMSKSHSGENNYWYGKNLSEEHRRNIGKTNKNPSLKTRDKMSKSHEGKRYSLESKKKKSEKHKELWKKPGYKESRSGKNSGRWLGGISFEPYTPDFNKRFKESIKERDNYCCVVCNKPQEELKLSLIVHHIDYNKLNSFPQNCVSLCRNCHTKTNFNRVAWTVFFQKLLKENYNYKYTQDQKIILDFIGGGN